ncbi:hypothetical protein DL769_000439 [Monosporascus sp. CRB-8-3]|nr:hypothetical protein DL769_000439 [Monosporascus sp. CRB-8-3]
MQSYNSLQYPLRYPPIHDAIPAQPRTQPGGGPRPVDDILLCPLPPTDKEKLEKLPALEGSNPEKSPSTGRVCTECSQLDFGGVLQHIKELREQKRLLKGNLVIANVGHRFRQTRDTECPLCLMLFASRIQTSMPPKGKAEDDYDELRAESFVQATNLLKCRSDRQPLLATTNDSLRLVVAPMHLSYAYSIENSSGDKPFVALSYVWGESSTTDCEKKDEIGRRLVASSLPATISHAITVTRALGYQYLWIDKFCIDQDNPETKHDQIKQMGAIYEQAELTIIAAAGIDENHGLPGVGRTPRSPQWIAQLQGTGIIWTMPDPHDSIRSSKWSTRGWTFQEGLLSRRRLAFTKDQVYFECKAMNCFESVRSPLDDMHNKEKTRTLKCLRAGVFGRNARMVFGEVDTHNLSFPRRFMQYLMTVEEYSAKNLRYDADVLHAFRGIERYFNREDTMRGFYGIPCPKATSPLGEKYFYHAVTWYHTRSCWEESGAPRRRPGFPSWSWVGWVGQVEFSYQGYISLDDDVPLRPMSLEGDSSTMVLQSSIYDSTAHETAPLRPILRVEGKVLPPHTISYHGGNIIKAQDWTIYGSPATLSLSQGPGSPTQFSNELETGSRYRCIVLSPATLGTLNCWTEIQRPDDVADRFLPMKHRHDVLNDDIHHAAMLADYDEYVAVYKLPNLARAAV